MLLHQKQLDPAYWLVHVRKIGQMIIIGHSHDVMPTELQTVPAERASHWSNGSQAQFVRTSTAASPRCLYQLATDHHDSMRMGTPAVRCRSPHTQSICKHHGMTAAADLQSTHLLVDTIKNVPEAPGRPLMAASLLALQCKVRPAASQAQAKQDCMKQCAAPPTLLGSTFIPNPHGCASS
jgi:hypothetical protein